MNIFLLILQLIFISFFSNLILENILCSHTASLLPWVASMYSTSVVDKATTSCHLLIKIISPSNIMNTYPQVYLCRSISPSQLTSKNPCTFTSFHIHIFLSSIQHCATKIPEYSLEICLVLIPKCRHVSTQHSHCMGNVWLNAYHRIN